ncbi:hypothetical protein PHYSODRAFT_426015, partial [Phytophthora sojae]
TDQAGAPSSPSPRTETAPSDSERPTAVAAADSAPPDVVDITGADEPWARAPARWTSDPAPLRMSKLATPKVVSGEALTEARKGKKKLAATTSKRAVPTPRSDSGFDLSSFMASFSPGTALEATVAPVDGSTAFATTPNEASVATDDIAPQDGVAVRAQLQELQDEVERLRALVAGQGLAQLPVAVTSRLHADPSAPTAPNNKGEMPPAEMRYLTTSSFPEGAKKAKGDYNPPQAHLLAASRMFR